MSVCPWSDIQGAVWRNDMPVKYTLEQLRDSHMNLITDEFVDVTQEALEVKGQM